MENIFIAEGDYSPLIEFNVNGNLKMSGKLLIEDVNPLFNPLINFVTNIEATSVTFDFNLQYFNTASSKSILNLLRNAESNIKIDSIMVHWHYEEGDEDSAEMCEIYEECLLRSEFRYHEYSETA